MAGLNAWVAAWDLCSLDDQLLCDNKQGDAENACGILCSRPWPELSLTHHTPTFNRLVKERYISGAFPLCSGGLSIHQRMQDQRIINWLESLVTDTAGSGPCLDAKKSHQHPAYHRKRLLQTLVPMSPDFLASTALFRTIICKSTMTKHLGQKDGIPLNFQVVMMTF